MKQIVIVGGGFSGASFAVQLTRASERALGITILEPRERVGPGLAYSATDADWRINAGIDTHSIDPQRPGELREWCCSDGVFERDGDAVLPSDQAFIRRSDMGRYLAAQIERHRSNAQTGSTIAHVRDAAESVSIGADGRPVVHASSGSAFVADLLVVATGNPPPGRQAPFAAVAGHPRVVTRPLEAGALDDIAADARVLVAGSGLTALDVLSTFVRRGHRAPIRVLSRRGLRPRPHSPAVLADAPPASLPRPFLDRVSGPVPAFIRALGPSPSVLRLTRALRAHIRGADARGVSWHGPFEELRDVVWQFWPALSAREKQRFMRKLRAWYDVHRFRAPPMNDALVKSAEARGLVAFGAARVDAIRGLPDGSLCVTLSSSGSAPVEETFDYVINCTGFDSAAGHFANPFARSLIAQGLVVPDPSGVGFAVDIDCRALDRTGAAQPKLRVVGPPTAGAQGDALGALFIAAQIHRILPDVLNAVD